MLSDSVDGGERVAQVVADLAGERGELLVGALQLPGPQLQLEQVDDAVGEADQRVLLLVASVDRGCSSKTQSVPITTPSGVRSWWVA